MYEIDFLPIEKTGEQGSRSGDSITMQFTEALTGQRRVVVIDGGFGHTGEQALKHIDDWYGRSHIDLVISTHPDQDHVNGLATIMEAAAEGQISIGELLIHRPHDHVNNATEMNNISVVDALITLAEEIDVPITEPFTGLQRFGGQLTILGPTREFYDELLIEQLGEERTGAAAARRAHASASTTFVQKAVDYLSRKADSLPFIETLSEDGDAGPRNESSVVTLIQVDGERMLFTGDAGIRSLSQAWDQYEACIGTYPSHMLDFFQVPHHGGHRNLAPSLLDRMFGKRGENVVEVPAFISSAKTDKDHPSPKVTNALQRRGVHPYATEGFNKVHKSADVPMRPGYSAATPIGPLVEDL